MRGVYTIPLFLFACLATLVLSELPKDSIEPKILLIGKDNTFECNGTGNFTWYKDGIRIVKDDPQYVITDKNLTIISADDADAGTYVCESGVIHTFIAKTRARVEMLPKSINLVEGDPLNLTCVVKGNPMPTVEWFKDGIPVKNPNMTRIELKPSANNVSDAVLYIEHLEDDDRADYMCSISNGVNDANTTVKIRVKDKLAALWPFLGIVAEVAILCTIILIYEKRRAKQEYDESDTDQNNESKPVADQKDKDVRQRK